MSLGINKISIRTIIISSVINWIGYYTWQIMFNNYAVEVFDASPTDVGIIQAAREIPGLLAFGVGIMAIYFAESRLAMLSIVIMGLGLILCGFASSILMLGLATVLMSFGFHYFEPANMSQLLSLAKTDELGKSQGKLLSYESMAGLAGAGLVLFLTLFLDYKDTFLLIGILVIILGIYLVIAIPSNRTGYVQPALRIKRKYWLFYVLYFLRGCRRHIFTTFAIFLLVKNHGLDITFISGIMLANNLITMFTNRYIGTLNDKLGEREVLAGCSFLLIFIFTGYAFINYLPLLIGFYLVDNILFGSSISIKSYLKKISDPEDLTGCLSFGMTANHITAVVIPVIGGVAWSLFGHKITFIAGAMVVFVDLLFSLKVPSKKTLKLLDK